MPALTQPDCPDTLGLRSAQRHRLLATVPADALTGVPSPSCQVTEQLLEPPQPSLPELQLGLGPRVEGYVWTQYSEVLMCHGGLRTSSTKELLPTYPATARVQGRNLLRAHRPLLGQEPSDRPLQSALTLERQRICHWCHYGDTQVFRRTMPCFSALLRGRGVQSGPTGRQMAFCACFPVCKVRRSTVEAPHSGVDVRSDTRSAALTAARPRADQLRAAASPGGLCVSTRGASVSGACGGSPHVLLWPRPPAPVARGGQPGPAAMELAQNYPRPQRRSRVPLHERTHKRKACPLAGVVRSVSENRGLHFGQVLAPAPSPPGLRGEAHRMGSNITLKSEPHQGLTTGRVGVCQGQAATC
ncbi:hypothetical protein TREES_T100010397 [Tupaia chinensis]|uniref:Uncharacterized protein n=1 Tax=Tupaia chinensis TaxID=246437 RepID=L9LCN2_TUPCH|nr:hypothetical protein TREES_T100010397 [Tupaia chinensis]